MRLDAATWTTTIQSPPERADPLADWLEATSGTLALRPPPALSSALSAWRQCLAAQDVVGLEQSEDWEHA